MSSSFLCRALAKFSGRSLLVISRSNHERAALAKCFASLIPMTLVRVDAADNGVVSQDHFGGDIACGGSCSPVTAPDTSKTDDASSRYFLGGVGYDRSGTRAFDDDIWPESDAGYATGRGS
jgi:hypothetical protein